MITAILMVGIITVNAFYLPGVAPIDYVKHELIDVKVTSIEPWQQRELSSRHPCVSLLVRDINR